MVPGQPSAAVQCGQCGADLPGNARFCLECGTPVAAAAERESRRTVTLLFTDVTGSTALGEKLDPEAYRSVMGRYFAVARAAVERHGGRVEKFVGDAVLAVFGMPEVREDDALRAVRAASELNAAVAELSERLSAELGVRLTIRTGVNTGAVVTGSARAGGSFATGDAVNTAARLEQAALPGQVLLGGTTYHLVRDAVEAEEVTPVRAKGKAEPVAAYQLKAVLDADRGRRRRDHGRLIGRDQETRALEDAFERTLTTGRSHLVTVLGPAGIGKSRLVSDFLTRVADRAAVASGRCVSYGQGITYWPLVQALRDALTLSGTESDEIIRHALERVLGAAADRDDVVEVLMPLLGRSGDASSGEATFVAVRRLLEELAAARPLVLALDDLHWAEPTLLELLERVRDEIADLPLLLVCQARPELHEQHPTWGAGALNALTFALDPLSTDETGTSVSAMLDGEVPDEVVASVVEWSGGNPLFVEEIVAHLVESGWLVRDGDGAWRLTVSVDTRTLPPTVSALLASRLDRLPAGERALLETLSVIGLELTADQAALLHSGDDLMSLLSALARRDLLRRVRSTAGESWAFKHMTVRDAAYEAMAKSQRAELHERFADGVSEAADGGLETDSFVAHHLAQAARYKQELGVRGPDVEALGERAVAALVRAAESAADREDYQASIGLFRQAEELAAHSPRALREILQRLAWVQTFAMAVRDQGDTLARLAATMSDETVREVDRAALACFTADWKMGASEEIDPAVAVALGDRLVSLAREAGEVRLEVAGHQVKGSAAALLGHWNEAGRHADEIVRLGSPSEVRLARTVKGAIAFYGPVPLTEAARIMRETLGFGATPRRVAQVKVVDATVAAAHLDPDAARLVREAQAEVYGLPSQTIGAIGVFLIDSFSLLRDLDAAVDQATRSNTELRAIGDTGHASTYILFQVALMLERGDPVEDVVGLIEEAAGYTTPYDALSVAYLAACRAVVASRRGNPAEATGLAEESLTVVDGTDQSWQQADLRRLVSDVFASAGNQARARAVLEEALERYRVKGIVAYDRDVAARLARLD